jgi:hypothetical protein
LATRDPERERVAGEQAVRHGRRGERRSYQVGQLLERTASAGEDRTTAGDHDGEAGRSQ